MCVVEFGAAGGGRIRWSRLLNAERDPVQSWGPSAESGTQCRIGIQHSVIWIFYRQRLGSPRTESYTARPTDRLADDKLNAEIDERIRTKFGPNFNPSNPQGEYSAAEF